MGITVSRFQNRFKTLIFSSSKDYLLFLQKLFKNKFVILDNIYYLYTMQNEVNMKSYEFKKIKVLGLTTDFNKCDCCGKENLKETVAILDIASEVVLHFGTTCAVSADKYDSLEALNAAKKELNSLLNAQKEIRKNAQRIAYPHLCSVFGYDSEKDYPKCDKKIANALISEVMIWLNTPWIERSDRFFQGPLQAVKIGDKIIRLKY